MGVVLVGPSGCGKTTIWKTLKKAYEKMGTTVKVNEAIFWCFTIQNKEILLY